MEYPFTHFLVCKNPGETPFTFGFFPSIEAARQSKQAFKHDTVVIVDENGKELQ